MTRFFLIIACSISLYTFCMEPLVIQDPQKRIYESLSVSIYQAIQEKKDLDEPLSECVPSCGNPPIIKAAQHDFTSLAEILIAHQVNVNTQRGLGFTALHFATEHNNRTLVQLLLAHNAQLELRSPLPFGYTPLHFALAEGHLGVVKDLLLAGANPNAQTANGEEPLTLILKACRDEDESTDQIRKNCMYWLLYCGAQSSSVDFISELVATTCEHPLFSSLYNLGNDYEHYKTQLFQAVRTSNYAMLGRLAKLCTVLMQDARRDCPLHIAVRNNDIAMTGLLLSINKQLIGVKNKLGHTPLHEAANGRESILELFLIPERNSIVKPDRTWTHFFWRFVHVVSCGMV